MGLRQPGQVLWDGGFVPHGGDERRGRVPGVAAGHEVSPGHGAGSGKLGELVANELREGGKAAGNGAWERHGETEVRINGLGGEQSFPQAIGGPGINVLLCGRSQSQRCSHLNIKSEPEPV